MGAAVAAQLQRHEITVLWRPAGRSDATTHRATAAGLTATTDLTEPLERSHIVLSIYPPAAAEDIATTVAAQAYQGPGMLDTSGMLIDTVTRQIRDTVTGGGSWTADPETLLLHNGMAGYCAHTSVETWSGGNPAITELLHKDPEHYRPQFGDIPPDLDYVWPRSDRSTAEEDGSWPRTNRP